MIQPVGDVRVRYRPFELDLKVVNFQPVEQAVDRVMHAVGGSGTDYFHFGLTGATQYTEITDFESGVLSDAVSGKLGVSHHSNGQLFWCVILEVFDNAKS